MAHPLGATPEGVHNLTGNVSEWVADWYGPYSRAAANDPTGSEFSTWRVSRGGSFYDGADDLRGSRRSFNVPGVEFGDLGFRVAWPGGQ